MEVLKIGKASLALTALLAGGFFCWISAPLWSDPCGMVPPIYTGPGRPIERVGLQQTYVFHDDGVESFVIRPGFRGKVDNFGMLIPFPSPPALRKVPDNVFDEFNIASRAIIHSPCFADFLTHSRLFVRDAFENAPLDLSFQLVR